jgi:hypothetical protein
MGTYRFSSHANLAPTEALFLWADLDRVTDWMDGVTRVSDVTGRPDRPDFTLPGRRMPLVISPESRYTLWYGRRPVRVEVLWLEEPRSTTAYRTKLDGTVRRGEMLVTFEPEGDGSRVTLEVRTEGRLSAFAGRLLATGAYRGSFRGQLRSFARVAERERWSKLII